MGIFTKTKKEEDIKTEYVKKSDFDQYIEMNNQLLGNMNQMMVTVDRKVENKVEESVFEKVVELLDRVEHKFALLENENKLLKNRVATVEDQSKNNSAKLDNHTERINKTDDKIHTFRFDDTGEFNKFKETCLARVHHIVGNKDNVKYILFYRPFASKIYSDICNYLKVQNSPSIRMEDAITATGMARKWSPNKGYIKRKMDEYQKRQDKGTLEEHKSKALDIYLEEIGGDHRNAF